MNFARRKFAFGKKMGLNFIDWLEGRAKEDLNQP